MSSSDHANSALFGFVKYRPPRMPPGAVVRSDLAARLTASDRTLVTTVLSAAGYGKTTALSAHFAVLEKSGHRVAWVRLAEAESDPLRFLESVFSAFEHLHAGLCAPALAILRNGGVAAFDQAIGYFFDRIIRAGKPCCLFLDDYHLAESPQTNAMILRLAEAAPSNFFLKLASRFHPAIDFSSLRLSSEISEISTSAFLFTRSETETLLGREGVVPLSADQHRIIERFAGGWAVGLQALVISARQRGSLTAVLARLATSEADVLRFFASEVVGGLSHELQWFLGASAKLGVFNAELCNEVFGIANAADLIAEIERMNLFVQPVGVNQDWLTYHDLFSEFLARQDPVADTARQSEINRKAYGWFVARDMHDFAIPFAIREKMWREAADGLELGWRRMLTLSQFVALEKLITQLPRDVLAARPELQIALAWSDSLQRKLKQAKDRITGIEGQVPLEPMPFVPRDETAMALFALKAAVNNMCGDVRAIIPLAEIEPASFDSLTPFERGIVLNCAMYAYVIAGQIDRAHRLANLGVEAMSEADLPLIAIHRELFRGMAYEVSGNLDAAFVAWSRAHDLALASFGFPYAPTLSMLASIHYERGDLSAARGALQSANAGLNGPSIIRPLILNHLISARVEASAGQVAGALELLGTGEELGRKDGNFELRVACLAERMRVLIDHDRLHEARQIEADLDLLTRPDREFEDLHWAGTLTWVALAKAHMALASGEADLANRIAEGHLLRCEGTGREGLMISFLLFGALAASDLGRHSEALHRFARAVALARRGGYFMTIANIMQSRPTILAEGLGWCAKNGEDREYLLRLAEASSLPRGSWIQFNSEFAEFEAVEMTERERDLLWMLSRGEVNKQIARNLDISVNTVAWHLKNIFAKLGVTNRTQAVKAAQRLGLIQ